MRTLTNYTMEELENFIKKQDFKFEPVFISYKPEEESEKLKIMAQKLKGFIKNKNIN